MYRNWRNIISPKVLAFDSAKITDSYGKFIASPLERGLGITIGNSLRRILLSSLQGAAIASMKVDGVLHEFTNIEGVTEDITDVVLNLKQVRLKLHEGDSDVIRLDISGKKEVTAADFITSDKVEILNPDLHIATVGSSGVLKGEFTVKMNKGYLAAEQNKSEEDPIGTIALDSIHSPVVRCNYNVTNARLGQRTDFDKLSMEIWTDGSVRPDDALAFSAKILKEQLQIFINFEEKNEPILEDKKDTRPALNENLFRRVEELELSVRSANCLQNANIKFIGELCQRTESEMLKTKNFGRKSLNEIKDILSNMGLSLGMNLEGFQVEDLASNLPPILDLD